MKRGLWVQPQEPNNHDKLVCTPGSLFAQACPGAGKTRAIVARFLKRTSEEPRKGIALLSFTNAAIDEVKQRCASNPEVLTAPHFVGTFDSFINRFVTRPLYVKQYNQTPRFVDTWESISSARFHLRDMNGMPDMELKWFSFDWLGRATLNTDWIPFKTKNAFGSLLSDRRVELEALSSTIFRRLEATGTISCAASRALMVRWLRPANMSQLVGTLLATRFSEVIIDEAQDCGPEELVVLKLLQDHGVTIAAVADLDQSIFEFRRADPQDVSAFAQRLKSQLVLDGNFRSSPAICAMNQSLRTGHSSEKPSGRNKDCAINVQLLVYSSSAEVAGAVTQLRLAHGLNEKDVVVLAHKAADARMCAGAADRSTNQAQRVVSIAVAGYELRSSATDSRSRLRAVASVEQALLAVVRDVSDADLTADDLCERKGINRRWLREAAVRLAVTINPSSNTRRDYTERVREHISQLGWPREVTPRADLSSLFRPPSETVWAAILGEDAAGLAWATIHSVKGREFPGVVVILPKNLYTDDTGRDVISYWETDVAVEMRRVLYVGASRAERLLIFAVHQSHIERVSNLLQAHQVPFEAYPPRLL